jgi:hypothetical protein
VAPPAGANVFTVPPGLSPSGLFDSPGLIFSPAMVRTPFRNTFFLFFFAAKVVLLALVSSLSDQFNFDLLS